MKSHIKKLPTVFWITTITTLILLASCLLKPNSLAESIKNINSFIFNIFGDFYLWFVLITFISFIFIGISPLGKIRIGGENAKPEHSFFSWFSMLFCAGMGIGMFFWGGAEPLYFFLHPPLDATSTILSKETSAFMFSFLHWGFTPWAIFGMVTLAICFYSMNLKRGIYFSSFLSKSNDNKIAKFIIDNITVISILFGIVTSFGMGVIQFEGGLKAIFNIKQSLTTEIAIVIVITICYITSTLRGLDKGIKILSNISMGLSFILLLSIFFVIPIKEFILPITKSFPAYMSNIYDLSIGNMPYNNSDFLQTWTTKYWGWWLAWAPFVGIFVSLISKGRTVRELIFSMLIAPSLFSIAWFTVFGEAAIFLQQHQNTAQNINFENVNMILFNITENLFSGPFIGWLALLLLALFFINSADSATYTLAAISQKAKGAIQITENNDIKIKTPPVLLQICWGLMFSILATLFVFTGGLKIIQSITLITVLPFSLLLVFVFIKLIFDMVKYYKKESLEL